MTTQEIEQGSSLREDLAAGLEAGEADALESAPPTEELEAQPEPIKYLDPHPMWKKEVREAFETWSKQGDDGSPLYPEGHVWQQRFHDLYSEGQKYTTQKEQEAAQARKQLEQFYGYANQWNNAIAPYRQLAAQAGIDEQQLVRRALGVLQSLRANPQATIMELARETGIDLNQIGAQQPYVSETEAKLERELRELKRQQAQWMSQQTQERQRQLQAEVGRIRSEHAQQLVQFVEQEDDGKPAHPYLRPDNPHFNTVQNTMAELILGRKQAQQQARATGRAAPPEMGLKEAYDRALALIPEIAQAEAERREKERAAEKSAQAKKEEAASKRVSGNAGKGKPARTLREEIEANIRAA